LSAQRRKEKVPFEGRQQIPAREGGARGSDRRRVLEQRRYGPLLRLAMVHEGPAVVLAGFDDIDLVAAAGTVEARGPVLGLKLEPRARVPVETLRVAMAVGKNRRSRKRIVGRDRAVGVQAQRLASERLQVLGDLPRRRVAGGRIELAVG